MSRSNNRAYDYTTFNNPRCLTPSSHRRIKSATTCYSHIKWNTGSRSTTSSHIAQSAMAPEAMNQDSIGSKGGCLAEARNKIMKARSLTRVPSYRHRGSPPRRRSQRGFMRRRCRPGSALLHPLHVTHRVCLLGDSIEEKGEKIRSNREGNPMQGRRLT